MSHGRCLATALAIAIDPPDVDSERRDEGPVQIGEPGGRKAPDQVCEGRLRQAHERVGVHAAVAAQAFVGPDGHLGGQPVAGGVHGSAHDGREPGVDQDLPADDDEHAMSLGIGAPARQALGCLVRSGKRPRT